MLRKLSLAPIVSGLLATSVMAHPGHGPHGTLEGPLHYLNGLEHVAAITAFGVIALVFWRLRVRKNPQRTDVRDRSGRR